MEQLVSEQRLDAVEKYVAMGKEEGATLATGGRRLSGGGFYYSPHHLRGRRQLDAHRPGGDLRARPGRHPLRHRRRGVRIANESVYGLAGAVGLTR